VRQIHRHALALGLVLALSACGGDPEPQFEADPSPAPSEATTSAPAKEAWEEKSDDGAIAFVEHWIDEFDASKSTGDTTDLVAISASQCQTCSSFIKMTDEIYAAGGQVDSAGWDILSISEPVRSQDEVRIAARIEQSPQRIRRSADAKVERFKGGEIDFAFTLRWASGHWELADMVVAQ
jgi:hypothetical protein